MENRPMKIIVIEDDVNDCNNFINCVQNREDIELVAITDSDIEGINLLKTKRPEGIVLDLELNNGMNGNTDALDFITNMKKLNLGYAPIVIVTTHVNSKRTYEILHRDGADLILYKDQPKYSSEYVLNKFISLRNTNNLNPTVSINDKIEDLDLKISNYIYKELDLIGVTSKMKGREYIHDAIKYLVKNDESNINVIQHLTGQYKKSGPTITNGIQNAIIHAWRVSPIEDLEKYYTARVNYETGIPTPMEFIYYYVDKVKKEL